MCVISNMSRCLRMIFVVMILMNFLIKQSSTAESRLRDIRIDPKKIVIDSTSVTDVVCINRQATDIPLEVKLSKPIPSNQIKLIITSSNISTVNIQLKTNDYIGYFHLLCYERGYEAYANLADVYVKADPGTIIRAKFCEVFDKQYVTCKIYARNLARAVQNGYKSQFEFTETSHPADRSAYIPRPEFLKSESTNEYLVFKWRPSVDGVFPRAWIHMRQSLQYFQASEYDFEIIPVVRIIPKYTVTALSSREVQINLTSISPSAYCEKSIQSLSNATANQTWTTIESGRNVIKIDNLLPKTIYRVCVKCRQIYTDPDGLEECLEMETKSTTERWWIFMGVLLAISILIIVVSGIAYSLWKWHQRTTGIRSHKPSSSPKPGIGISNSYEGEPTFVSGSNDSLEQNDESSSPLMNDAPESTNSGDYISFYVRNVEEVNHAHFPEILASEETRIDVQ